MTEHVDVLPLCPLYFFGVAALSAYFR